MKSSKFRHTQTHLCMLEDRLNQSSPLVTPGCYANEAVKHHSQRYFSCPCLCRHYFLSTLDCLFFRAFLHLFPFLLTWHTSSSFPIIPFSSSLSYSPLWLFILSFLPLPPSPLLPSFPHALASSFIPACLRALPLLLAPPRLFCISSFCVLSSFHLSLCAPYPIISTLHSSSPFSNNPV